MGHDALIEALYDGIFCSQVAISLQLLVAILHPNVRISGQ